jgi:hypothetical protein
VAWFVNCGRLCSVRFFGFCRCCLVGGRWDDSLEEEKNELNVPQPWQFFSSTSKGLVVASANFVSVLLTIVSS